jgi:hypothetical protein
VYRFAADILKRYYPSTNAEDDSFVKEPLIDVTKDFAYAPEEDAEDDSDVVSTSTRGSSKPVRVYKDDKDGLGL